MEGVKEVHQLDDKRLYWRAEIGGKEVEWNAEISEQTPDHRIARHSTTGARNAGQVSFQMIDANNTRVTLLLDYQLEGIAQSVGEMLGKVERRVEGDLARFKDFIESRGREPSAWRGEIHTGREVKPGTQPTTSG